MGFKNMKRDDHGHVISNDEVDGQKCKHQSGGNNNVNPNFDKKKFGEFFDDEGRLIKGKENEYFKAKGDEAFDDDYEEEFKEPSPEDEKQYVDKVMADIADASDKNAFEYVSDNIDKLTEAGLISDETSDRLMDALNRKIDEVNNDDEDLIKAINAADDDVLDNQFGKDTPERKLVGAMKEQPLPERKYIRYPNGQIRWKDEIYPDEGALEDIAGQDALKEIVDANDEENEERNFENEIEKRFNGWRPHWTNRKKNGGAHFENDAFLNSFDYDNKVYKNTDDRIKWNRDMAEYHKKNGNESLAKEFEDNANFIESNKDRFAKYEKQANESRGRRWLQLYGENAKVSDLKHGLKDGKYTAEDLMKYLKGN